MQKKTGIDRSQINRSFRQQTDFGTMSLEKISDAYPELSIQWVVTGKGEMLIGEDLPHTEKEIINLYQGLESKTDMDHFFIQSLLFEKELLERKILIGSFELHADQVSEESRTGIFRELMEGLLGIQFRRREKTYSYLEKSRAFDQMEMKGESYSGELSDIIKEQEWMERITEMIEKYILLESEDAKKRIKSRQGG